MVRVRLMVAGLLMGIGGAAPSAAALGTYVVTGTGAGTLAASDWSGSFTIRLVADLSRLDGNPTDPGITLLPVLPYATVELEDRETSATLGFDTLLGQDRESDTVALLRATPADKDNPILLDFRTESPVNLLETFGPVAGLEIWRFGDWRDVDTSAGRLSIVSIDALSFSGTVSGSTVVPEPATWAMLIAG